MTRGKKLLLVAGGAAVVLFAFLTLGRRDAEKPDVQVPPGFRLTHVDKPMSTIELAAFARNERYAATAPRWFYEGPGDPKEVADVIERTLAKMGTWHRLQTGDRSLFIDQSRSGAIVIVAPYMHYGPVKDRTTISITGPLQRPGLIEKTLAIFPLDAFAKSKSGK